MLSWTTVTTVQCWPELIWDTVPCIMSSLSSSLSDLSSISSPVTWSSVGVIIIFVLRCLFRSAAQDVYHSSEQNCEKITTFSSNKLQTRNFFFCSSRVVNHVYCNRKMNEGFWAATIMGPRAAVVWDSIHKVDVSGSKIINCLVFTWPYWHISGAALKY